MKVMCINGYEGLLTEGEVYTVIKLTKQGNFLLEEVEVPEPYTSFNSDRFIPIENEDSDLTEQLEKQFWSEQPTTEYNA
jgi:hypothetical protein